MEGGWISVLLLTVATCRQGEGGGSRRKKEHGAPRKEFIIMFARRDHLPLDRIITRFSAPTTIMQFQRSSSDGILIELARLVTHGANDNIFCLSETWWIQQEGGATLEGRAGEAAAATLRCSFQRFGSDQSCIALHTLAALPGECTCKLRAVRAWCMVRG